MGNMKLNLAEVSLAILVLLSPSFAFGFLSVKCLSDLTL